MTEQRGKVTNEKEGEQEECDRVREEKAIYIRNEVCLDLAWNLIYLMEFMQFRISYVYTATLRKQHLLLPYYMVFLLLQRSVLI